MTKFVWFVIALLWLFEYTFIHSGHLIVKLVEQSVPPTLIVSHIIGKGHTTSLKN